MKAAIEKAMTNVSGVSGKDKCQELMSSDNHWHTKVAEFRRKRSVIFTHLISYLLTQILIITG